MNTDARDHGEQAGLPSLDNAPKALKDPIGGSTGGEGDLLDLAAISQILWTRRFWMLGAGALGLALALIYSLLQTPLYRASATLELNPPVVPILGAAGQGAAELTVPTTDWQFLETQYGLLRSRNLARRVVEDLNLINKSPDQAAVGSAEDRIEAKASSLSGGLTVTPRTNSRIVELTYTSADPQEAARYVNGFAEAFLASTLDRRYEATANARQFLERRLATARTALDESERKLVAYAKANNIILAQGPGGGKSDAGGSAGGGSLAGASLVALNAALAEAQQKRITAEQRFGQASTITETNKSTAALREERSKLEAEYREKATIFNDDYPEMVRLRSKIDALDQAIRREASQASSSLRAEYNAALAEEKSLRTRVEELSANVMSERERSVQYNILQRELDTNRALYDALLERYNEVGVSSGVGTAQASIVDRGQVPRAPFSPNITRNLLLGLLLGLALGATIALVYEVLTDIIKSPDDVRRKLGMPALGVIPKKKRGEELSEQLADPKTPIAEAYNAMITSLQFTTSKGIPQILLVTSSSAAEGKSTSSLVLAKMLAESGKRVLLVDADMRKPSFFIPERSDIGLSRLLTGEGDLEPHIVQTSNDGLCLMPSGPIPPNPSQLLGTPLVPELIARLRKMFDIVVLDAPPTHGFADAPLLGALSDGVLFIVESGRTRRGLALESLIGLRAAKSTILGVVLTKYESVIGNYGYTYRYYDQYRDVGGRKKPHELMPQLLDGASQA